MPEPLVELERAYPEIRAEGAELLAISVDNLNDARQMQALTGARSPSSRILTTP